MCDKPVAAGKSSLDLIDKEKALALMDIQPDWRFADLACGPGDYSIEIARRVGEAGIVYAVDLWREGIEALGRLIAARGIGNIETVWADIRSRLPFADRSIDACLLATILHDLPAADRPSTLRETARILKPAGVLNIIEFKKTGRGPGPPQRVRLDEQDIEALVTPFGFTRLDGSEVGEFLYLLKYEK
ncbi:MAG: methyltransferase domain-containing protein [Thermodesulfobacteriota bacterium]